MPPNWVSLGGDEVLVELIGGDDTISAILKEKRKSHFRGLGGELISTLRLEELRLLIISKGERWLNHTQLSRGQPIVWPPELSLWPPAM